MLCGIGFYLLGKDSPSEHPSIPFDEKEYIEMSLGITEIDEVIYSFNILYKKKRNEFTSIRFVTHFEDRFKLIDFKFSPILRTL